jgi:AmiR/NasT family two-component response regulator
MTRTLRILVADDESEMAEYYHETLTCLGHQVVAVARTGQELIDLCRAENPDLVITDIKMPDLDGLDAVMEIARHRPVPVILVSAYHDPELITRALDNHVLAYLVKPVKQTDLEVAIALALRRFREFEVLREEAANLRQAITDRKVIERAKGIIMKRTGLDEQAAFRRLQTMASDRRQKLIDIAQSVLTAEATFGGAEK